MFQLNHFCFPMYLIPNISVFLHNANGQQRELVLLLSVGCELVVLGIRLRVMHAMF